MMSLAPLLLMSLRKDAVRVSLESLLLLPPLVLLVSR